MTDTAGRFQIVIPGAADYYIRARAIGYTAKISPALTLTPTGLVEIEMLLAPLPVSLPPVGVVAPAHDQRLERFRFYERERMYGAFGHFLERDALRPTAMRVSDLLHDLPGMHVTAAGGTRVVVLGRQFGLGRRPCTFYLDGVMVGAEVDGMIIPSHVVAIEVFPGMVAPIEYGGKGCVVAVWSGMRERHDRDEP